MSQHSFTSTFKTGIPNFLTLCRLFLLPVLFALVHFAEDDIYLIWVAVVLYSLIAITDFLDGHLARIWNVQSTFGKVFDPVADKALIVMSILTLASTGAISGWALIPAHIIIFREIVVSGLRDSGNSSNEIPVNLLGKLKTASQMVAIPWYISSPVYNSAVFMGNVFLCISAVLTVVSGLYYLFIYSRTGSKDS